MGAEHASGLQARLDRNYRYQRLVYDVTRRYYLLGRDALLEGLAPPHGGSILEIGCGTARNLVRCASLYPASTLYGLDLSEAMLSTARRKLARLGLAERVRLAHGDAVTFDAQTLLGRTAFDRIFFSYSLSMIPQWEAALAHALAHLSPGGEVHAVDFGSGERLPAAARRALHAWLRKFHVTPRATLAAALGDLATPREATFECTSLYGSYAARAVIRRTLLSHECQLPVL